MTEEGIQPNILQPHMSSLILQPPQPLQVLPSWGPPRPSPGRPPLESWTSITSPALSSQPCRNLHHQGSLYFHQSLWRFYRETCFKCYNILKLNKNKQTKCSRSNWKLCCPICSVCPTLCDPMACSTLGSPVFHCLPDCVNSATYTAMYIGMNQQRPTL